MSNIRPGDATHTDPCGRYYKPDAFNGDWLLYENSKWRYVGPMTDGVLTLLPPPAVVTPSSFDATEICNAFQVPFPREEYSGIPAPDTHPATSQPMPTPQVHDQAEAFTKLVTSLEDETPFTAYFTEYRFVGSRITCNQPPLDTDQDVLALVHQSNHAVTERKMLAAGFTKEGSNPAELGGNVDKESVFHSYRKGDMNYIVTGDRDFYERFSTATELARKYNLMAKADRIQLFQAVLYGKWWA